MKKVINENTDDTNKIKQHEKICNELNFTYECKNADYGDSFGKSFTEFGLISAVVRMNDKMERIKQLSRGKGAKVEESIEDSLLDLANYCIMTVIEMDLTKGAK